MKVWIDKHGGMHYHKVGCQAIQPRVNPPHFKYEEIEHQIRRGHMVYDRSYRDITIEGKRYHPCPLCFGYDRRG